MARTSPGSPFLVECTNKELGGHQPPRQRRPTTVRLSFRSCRVAWFAGSAVAHTIGRRVCAAQAMYGFAAFGFERPFERCASAQSVAGCERERIVICRVHLDTIGSLSPHFPHFGYSARSQAEQKPQKKLIRPSSEAIRSKESIKKPQYETRSCANVIGSECGEVESSVINASNQRKHYAPIEVPFRLCCGYLKPNIGCHSAHSAECRWDMCGMPLGAIGCIRRCENCCAA